MLFKFVRLHGRNRLQKKDKKESRRDSERQHPAQGILIRQWEPCAQEESTSGRMYTVQVNVRVQIH